MDKHTLTITGDQITFFGCETFSFDTAEKAAEAGYTFAGRNPNVWITREINGRMVSSYSPNNGWL